MGETLKQALEMNNQDAKSTNDLIIELIGFALKKANLMTDEGNKKKFKAVTEDTLQTDWKEKFVNVVSKNETELDGEQLKEAKADVDKWSAEIGQECVKKLSDAFKKMEEDDLKKEEKIRKTTVDVLKNVVKHWDVDNQWPGYNLFTGYKKRMTTVAEKCKLSEIVSANKKA